MKLKTKISIDRFENKNSPDFVSVLNIVTKTSGLTNTIRKQKHSDIRTLRNTKMRLVENETQMYENR